VNGVFICGDDADVEELPAHRARSAADTLAELQDRLSTARFDFSGVAASLENGVLCLRGFVKDSAAKLRAQAIGFSVEGVIQVENLLETNLTITDRVKEALESDPRTREPFIEVAHDRGIVTLSGKVSSPATRGAAEEITANLPGVISVVNALEVLDDHPRPKPDSDAAAVLKG
jgi:osmotically-inducible protein OsmY